MGNYPTDQKPHHNLYGAWWRRNSKAFLAVNPLCAYCARLGIDELATVVDHIKPHKGDRWLFRDKRNWQGLCKTCHDSVKKREEITGVLVGNDVTGNPIDPDHPWNKEELSEH